MHICATLALVGLIWTIHVVHYPLFARVGADQFRAYHAGHTTRMGIVVGPLMLSELVSAVILLVAGVRSPLFLASLAPLAYNWIATALIQIPLHRALSDGFDPETHRRLVTSNWWRTGAWTARGLCLLAETMLSHGQTLPG